MSHTGFLYYVPGATSGLKESQWQQAGLAYLPAPSAKRDVRGGPDGGAGVIAGLAEGELRYAPERQQWRKLCDALAWVGLWTDRPAPGPTDLVRPSLLDAVGVELLDERTWQVPIVRRYSEAEGQLWWAETLPRAWGLDETGVWRPGEVVRRWRWLSELAARWDDARMAMAVGAREIDGHVVAALTWQDTFGAAVQALSAHYALGRTEATLLQLLGEQQVFAVLDALIDLPTRAAYAKKKRDEESAGAASSPGPADSIPTTPPA